MAGSVTKALLVRIQALPGKEEDVERLLREALSIVEDEPETLRWFAVRFGPSLFGVFDAFPDEEGRQAHLTGGVARALAENAGKLFDEPSMEPLDVIAEKAPQ